MQGSDESSPRGTDEAAASTRGSQDGAASTRGNTLVPPNVVPEPANGARYTPVRPAAEAEARPLRRGRGGEAKVHRLYARASREDLPEPDRAGAWSALGRVFSRELRDPPSAIDAFRRSLALQWDVVVAEELALLLSSIGDVGEAARLARSGIGRIENDEIRATLALRAGTWAARAGDRDDALALFRDPSLQRVFPAVSLEAEAAALVALAAEGELPGGGDVERSSRRSTTTAVEAWLRAAQLRETVAERASAVEDLRRAVEALPDHAEAVDALVARYEQDGQAGWCDEILRRAGAFGHSARHREWLRRRAERALARGDLPLALHTVLEAELDGTDDEGRADVADRVFAAAGLGRLVALRRERIQTLATQCAVAALLEDLHHEPERAIFALGRALRLAPDADEPRERLLALAEQPHLRRRALGEFGRAIEALGRAPELAETLANAAETRGMPVLTAWARLRGSGGNLAPERATVDAARARLVDAKRKMRSGGDGERAEGFREYFELASEFPIREPEFAEALVDGATLGLLTGDFVDLALETAEVTQDRALLDALASTRALPVERVALLRAEIAFAHRDPDAAVLAEEADRLLASPGSAALFHAATSFAPHAPDDRLRRARALLRSAEQALVDVRAVLVAQAHALAATVGSAGEFTAQLADQLLLRPPPAQLPRTSDLLDAVERELSSRGPTVGTYDALANAREMAGDFAGALAAAQRAATLRPGDLLRAARVLDLASVNGDAERVADALDWLATQPLLQEALATHVATALLRVSDRDARAGATLGARVVGLLSARSFALRQQLLQIAAKASDEALAILVLEAWIGLRGQAARPRENTEIVADRGANGFAKSGVADDHGERLGTLWLALAERRSRRGDTLGEVLAVTRALEAGASWREVDDWLAEFNPAEEANLDVDGRLLLLGARLHCAQEGGDGQLRSFLLRQRGSLLWDAAGDQEGAIRIWLEAARLRGERGYRTLAADLIAHAGSELAMSRLELLGETAADSREKAALYTESARAAAIAGLRDEAFSLAERANATDPKLTAALEIAEMVASSGDAMSALYDSAGRAALGRFGVRAAHHRGSRFFARRGDGRLAMKHAAAAFRAVPSEHGTLPALLRAAALAVDTTPALDALADAAEAAHDGGAKGAWLLRAARLAAKGRGTDGLALEYGLRAIHAAPQPRVVGILARLVRKYVADHPSESEFVEGRLRKSFDALCRHAEGPDGARVLLGFVELDASAFRGALAWEGVLAALACDGDVDEYALLVQAARSLARAPGAEAGFFNALSLEGQPLSNVGTAARRFLAAVAEERGARDERAFLLIKVAKSEQEDDDIRVAVAAVRNGSAAASEALRKAFPAARLEPFLTARAADVRPGVPTPVEPLAAVPADALEKAAAPSSVDLTPATKVSASPPAEATVPKAEPSALTIPGSLDDVWDDLPPPTVTADVPAEALVAADGASESRFEAAEMELPLLGDVAYSVREPEKSPAISENDAPPVAEVPPVAASVPPVPEAPPAPASVPSVPDAPPEGRTEDPSLVSLAAPASLPRPAALPSQPPVRSADAWVQTAREAESAGDFGRALDAAVVAAETSPERGDLWELVAEFSEAIGDADTRIAARIRAVACAGRGGRAGTSTQTQTRRTAELDLARAYADAGKKDEARRLWTRLFEENPADPLPSGALQAQFVEEGRYDALATHLGQRISALAARPDRDELEVRALRMRRAAVLDEHLSAFALAAEELLRVLDEHARYEPALRYLADLEEKRGRFAESASLWRRILEQEGDRPERSTRVRLAALLHRLGRGDEALALLDATLEDDAPPSVRSTGLRIEILRSREAFGELGDALEAFAEFGDDAASVRADLLVEASQAAARVGNMYLALKRARRGADLCPEAPGPQLYARGLEYRLRGIGTPDEARDTAIRLRGIRGIEDANDEALRAFLLAESLDGIEGGNAGLRALVDTKQRIGLLPLVALGLAERYVSRWTFQEALPCFRVALGGDLLGLRRRGAVALSAADAAMRVGDTDSSLLFLEEAAKDADVFVSAHRKIAQLAIQQGDLVRARAVLRAVASTAVGDEKAEALGQLARALLSSSAEKNREEGVVVLGEALESANPHSALAATLRQEFADASAPQEPMTVFDVDAGTDDAEPIAAGSTDEQFGRPSSSLEDSGNGEPLRFDIPLDARSSDALRSAEPDAFPDPASRRAGTNAVPDPASRRAGINAVPDPASRRAETNAYSARGSLTPAPPLVTLPDGSTLLRSAFSDPAFRRAETNALPDVLTDVTTRVAVSLAGVLPDDIESLVATARILAAEGRLVEAVPSLEGAVRSGSAEAADLLAHFWGMRPDGKREQLKVLRSAAELAPGDLVRLARVREAALADHDRTYARAVEHVLRAFDPAAGPLPPPPLSAQIEQPGLFQLLLRHTNEPAGRAMGLAWDAASSVFLRLGPRGALDGAVRVIPGPASTLGKLLDRSAHLLEAPNVPIYGRSGETVRASTALAVPPAGIVAGPLMDETAELRYALGEALASALPQNALLSALPREQAKNVYIAICAAFGTDGPPPRDGEVLSLVEMLWQVVPLGTQRRLRDLLSEESRSVRGEPVPFELVLERSRHTARRVGLFVSGDFRLAAERVVRDLAPNEVLDASTFSGLCERIPSLADLYRLAIRPEYADARWREPTRETRRISSGGVRIT